MVWGDCVNNAFVVMLTAERIVFSLTVETKKKVNLIGYSQTIPRIFETTVLMNNLTHAIIYDLYTSSKLDIIKQEFVMGYIIRNVDRCKTFAKLEKKVTFRDIMSSMSGWLMMLMMATLIVCQVIIWCFSIENLFYYSGCCVYYKKIKKCGTWVKRKKCIIIHFFFLSLLIVICIGHVIFCCCIGR